MLYRPGSDCTGNINALSLERNPQLTDTLNSDLTENTPYGRSLFLTISLRRPLCVWHKYATLHRFLEIAVHVLVVLCLCFGRVVFMFWSCCVYVLVVLCLCFGRVMFVFWSCCVYVLVVLCLCFDRVVFMFLFINPFRSSSFSRVLQNGAVWYCAF